MKVIHIMDNLGVSGGVNSFVYDLCKALKYKQIEVYLIGILKSEESNQIKKLKEYGIKVVSLGAKNKKDALIKYKNKLRKEIQAIAGNEFTICNLHLKLSVLMGGMATIGLKNVKCIETYHSEYKNYFLEYFLMQSRISLYIPCSKSAEIEMIKRFRVPRRKLFTIPNGIDTSFIDNVETEHHDGIIILSVGRLSEQKNYAVTIDAFNNMCTDMLCYNIIGSGEQETFLKSRVKNSYIHFLGRMSRKKVLEYTAKADIICMPSLWEGLSIYMMEAFSMGKPMILSNIPSFCNAVGEERLHHNEVYRKCEWGYLVETTNPAAYKQALEDFLKDAKIENVIQNRRKACMKIASNFDIKNTAAKYIDAYQSIKECI